MSRPVQARINLNAIRHNYRLAKELGNGCRALAVVKADAYGHGAVQVSQALSDDADGFAVASIEEALELREAGIRQPILLLEGTFCSEELSLVEQQSLSTVVHTSQQISQLAQYPNKTAQFDVWLKVDIGMHRLGMPIDEAVSAIETLLAIESVTRLTLMGHFSCADELENPLTREQLNAFIQRLGGKKLPISLANSAAVLGWPETHQDWLRPGLMLYGATPFDRPQVNAQRLIPAMTLETEVIALRTVNSGDAVGYGSRWRAERESLIGTLAIGYADGYPRQLRCGAPILVGDKRAPLAGRVSMDMVTVDLTDLPSTLIGDRVELFGARLAATELAPWADTVAYTLFTGITKRVPRIYLND